jgi:hypothetical protein
VAAYGTFLDFLPPPSQALYSKRDWTVTSNNCISSVKVVSQLPTQRRAVSRRLSTFYSSGLYFHLANTETFCFSSPRQLRLQSQVYGSLWDLACVNTPQRSSSGLYQQLQSSSHETNHPSFVDRDVCTITFART